MEKYSPRNVLSSARRAFDNFRMEVGRKAKDVPIMLCVILLTSLFHIGGTVWSVPAGHMLYKAYFLGVTPNKYCGHLQGLTPRQLRFCKNMAHRAHMASVLTGANLALEECRYQFRNSRWNCLLSPKDMKSVFGRITGLRSGNRESSFTYAISSAGVAWAVSRACSKGNLSACSCGKKRCSDNTQYGEEISTRFLDNYGEKELSENSSSDQKARTLMNIHNNNVGRKLVSSLRSKSCRCHGNTGYCNVQTCWKQLPQFRKVGTILRRKYKRAVHVKFSKDKKSGKEYLRRRDGSFKSFTSRLVYLERSPDYCIKNEAQNIPGTKGRLCSRDHEDDEDGLCENLCCNRGYRATRKTVTKRCRCQFWWCCFVKCDKCKKTVDFKTCN